MRGTGVGVVVAVAVGLSGCGSGGGGVSPGRTSDQTVGSWLAAMDRGDLDGACRLMTTQAKKSVPGGHGSCADALRTFRERYKKLGPASFLGTLASADRAASAITLTLETPDGPGDPRVRLVRAGDRWLITRINR